MIIVLASSTDMPTSTVKLKVTHMAKTLRVTKALKKPDLVHRTKSGFLNFICFSLAKFKALDLAGCGFGQFFDKFDPTWPFVARHFGATMLD